MRALAIVVIILATVSARAEPQIPQPPASPAASQRYQFSACLRRDVPLKPHELDCVMIEGRGTFEDCGKARELARERGLTTGQCIHVKD